MFKIKIKRLIDEFGVKQNKLIELIESNRVEFGKKRKDNSFSLKEQKQILDVYGKLL